LRTIHGADFSSSDVDTELGSIGASADAEGAILSQILVVVVQKVRFGGGFGRIAVGDRNGGQRIVVVASFRSRVFVEH
jgi:hypothetical protein